CAKVLLDAHDKSHKKFESSKIHSDLAIGIIGWFERRDKNVKLSFDNASITKLSPTQSHMKFKGSTKDADFVLDCSLGVFISPSFDTNSSPLSFLKTLAIAADKASFVKRKV
ncbi:MAG: hypothetical protein M1368_03610, partial [Thaumarchaeota archaeon]|nr:hypothetical protein [Nitrososphaerota archaeon]